MALRLVGLHFAGNANRVYCPKRYGVRRSRGYEDYSTYAAKEHATWAKEPTDYDHVVVAATSEPVFRKRYICDIPPQPFWVGVSKVPNHDERTFDYRVIRLTDSI